MASKKLNYSIRNEIKNGLLKHRFHEDYSKLQEDFIKLADDVYNDVLSAKKFEKFHEVPESWFAQASSISVKFGESFVSFQFGGPYFRMRERIGLEREYKSRAFPKNLDHCAKTYSADHSFKKRYDDLESRQAALKTSYDELNVKLTSVLDSVTTTNALVKAWPEIEPFIPVTSRPVNLPQVPVASLNKDFKLPVSS